MAVVLSTAWGARAWASIRDRGGTNEGTGGNSQTGAEDHLPVGRSITPTNPTIYRALMRFFVTTPGGLYDGGGIYRLVRATLWMRTSSADTHLVKGSSPSITIRRVTSTWSATASGTSEGTWSSGYVVTAQPTSTATGELVKAIPNDDAKWRSFDVTAIVGAWMPVSVVLPSGSPGGAQPDYGLLVRATDETVVTSAQEFNSSGTDTARPYLEVEYEESAPPRAPIISSPITGDGGAAGLSASTSGRQLVVTGTADDPDPGQVVPVQQVQVYGDAATDGALTTVIQNVTFTGLRNAFTLTLPATLISRATYRHRVRSGDGSTAWGPWTSLANGRFSPVPQPGIPNAPYFVPYGTSGNDIYASLVSGDSADYITASDIEVYEDPASGGAILKWASGEQSIGGTSTRAEVSYGGSQLLVGRIYRWRIRLRNRDSVWSPWTAWQFVTIVEVTGPDSLSPQSTATKQLTRTPTLTVAHSANFDAHQVRIYAATGELIHDSGLVAHASDTSVDYVVPSGLLEWGSEPTWEAAVRLTGAGELGPFSPRFPFRINSLPATPGISLPEAIGGVTPTLDPLISAGYVDDDVARYGEIPSGKELEVRVAATPVGSGTRVERRMTPDAVDAIPQSERIGRQLDALQTTTGWTPQANVAVATYSATNPTGYSGNSLEVQATGGSSTDRSATKTVALDLSIYGGGAWIRLHRRFTSTTNLTAWRLYFVSAGGFVGYDLALPAEALNTWAEIAIPKDDPSQVSGTMDWSTVTALTITADVSAAYTGNLEVRDLRIGTTQTAKTVPDGYLVPEASYDFRVRYRDDALAKVSSTLAAAASAGATNIKYTDGTWTGGDQIEIRTAAGGAEELPRQVRTIAAVGTSGAGGTGLTLEEALDYAHASGDPISTRYWGPWSGWVTAKVSRPPTVTANTPADASVTADPTPALTHTFTSPGGKTQASVTTRLYLRGTDDALIAEYSETGTGLSTTLPRFLLTDGLVYAWEKEAFDTDGLSGITARRSFTLTLGTIDDITGLVATADTGTSSVLLTWTTSTETFLDHYRVYWRDDTGAWLRIDGGPATYGDTATPLTVPTFTHYGARLGVNEYAVAAHVGSSSAGLSEGNRDAATAEATLETQRAVSWAFAVPDGTAIEYNPTSAPREQPSMVEGFRVPGREDTVHLHHGSGTRSWTVDLEYWPSEDGDISGQFRRISREGLAGWNKAPTSWRMDPWYVLILDVRDTLQEGGQVRTTLSMEATST
jgi:hypothetical protein